MRTTVQDFAGRNIQEDIKDILNKYGNSIDYLVDFGAQIIDWDLNRHSKKKKDAYLIPILFLRNLLENIDAMGILIRAGASDPAMTPLQTVVENFFSLEYLLAEKEEERCMSFHTWNSYKNYKFYEKLDGESDQAKQFATILKKDKQLKDASPIVLKEVEAMKANVKALLALPIYQEFATEYERTKKKLNKSNPIWYSLYDGPRNIEALANASKFAGLYEVYRGLSNVVHGVDIIQGKISPMDDGKIGIDQIRCPKEAHSMTLYAHNLSIATFTTYIEKRVPERRPEYQKWITTVQPFRVELTKGNPINFVG